MIQLNSGWFGGRPALASAQLREAVDLGFYGICLLPGEPALKWQGLELARKETGAKFGAAAYCSLTPNKEEGVAIAVDRLKLLGCGTMILSAPLVDDKEAQSAGEELLARAASGEDISGDEALEQLQLKLSEMGDSDRQLEDFTSKLDRACRSYPGLNIALRVNPSPASLLNLAFMEIVLEQLNSHPIGLWHCTGAVATREGLGLEKVGDWLDLAPRKIQGCSLHDYALGNSQLLPGEGEVDFSALGDYLPRDCHRALAIAPAYPREELEEAVRLLESRGIK